MHSAKTTMEKHLPTLGIIVPAYNEECVIRHTCSELMRVLDTIQANCVVVFVDDGSTDSTAEILKELCLHYDNVSCISFSRNCGHQVAVTAGLDVLQCDAAVVIDADLQDPPLVIRDMFAEWQNGADIVVGVRRKRNGEGLFKRLSAHIFYKVIAWLDPCSSAENAGDFRLYSNRAIYALSHFRERDRYIRGLSALIGLKKAFVIFDRSPRLAGTSKYGLLSMVLLAWTAFLNSPGTLASVFYCLSFLLFSAGAALICIDAAWGAMSFSFFSGVVLISTAINAIGIAVLSGSIGRVYFESKNRPLYLIDRIFNDANLSLHSLPNRAVILPASKVRVK